MKKKLMMMVAAAALGLTTVAFADPEVTDVTAAQRYPWNGLVDIRCKVAGIESGVYSFAVVAVDKDTNKEYTASQFTVEKGGTGVSGWEVAENGDYKLLWDARADMGQVVVERMIVRISLEALGVSAGKVQLWAGGPYWADRNIGADKPEDYGLYFWWGDTKGHSPLADRTFSFSFTETNLENVPTYNKNYATLRSEGWITSSGVLAPAHDAAHVKWGGAWRMPTDQELIDLNNNCDWTWTTLNGVNGYVVRGRGAYAGNSIFLPAAGTAASISYGHVSSRLASPGEGGFYCSSVPYPDDGYYASYACTGCVGLSFYSHYHLTDNYGRCFGRSVRPVQGVAK